MNLMRRMLVICLLLGLVAAPTVLVYSQMTRLDVDVYAGNRVVVNGKTFTDQEALYRYLREMHSADYRVVYRVNGRLSVRDFTYAMWSLEATGYYHSHMVLRPGVEVSFSAGYPAMIENGYSNVGNYLRVKLSESGCSLASTTVGERGERVIASVGRPEQLLHCEIPVQTNKRRVYLQASKEMPFASVMDVIARFNELGCPEFYFSVSE